MKIAVKTIPHKSQRYETPGDWWWKNNDLEIRVSRMDNWKYESLIAIHEIVEAVACKTHGIKQKRVEKFDIAYEKNRKEGDMSEPGDEPNAPYNFEHGLATGVERIIAVFLKVKWKDYDKKVNGLRFSKKQKKK
ncbi:MAG: hypothetical protein Q7R98_02400 [Candidatus Jorgensenbacteria bacterium]|nr:hypothetical protein [Candidatus Jorgensenbacteria bacterium]